MIDIILMKDLYKILNLLCLVQALFLTIVLLFKKNNKQADYFASFAMFITAIDLFEVFLAVSAKYKIINILHLNLIPYQYILGPCIFYYYMFMISRLGNFRKKDWLLFLPAGIIFIAKIILNYHFPKQEWIIYSNTAEKNNIKLIFTAVGSIFEIILAIIAYNNINIYVKRLKQYFSKINRQQITWLRITLIVLFGIELTVAGFYRNKEVTQFQPGMMELLTMLCALLLFFAFTFLSVIQPELLTYIKIKGHETNDNGNPKYKKSRMGLKKEEDIVSNIKIVMREKKPYLREDISLNDLAKILSISTNHLSMILNLHFNMNFYTFINTYRIDEAKNILSTVENSDETILSVAYRSGFNSKTTFNTMFKKITGITPSQYRAGFLK